MRLSILKDICNLIRRQDHLVKTKILGREKKNCMMGGGILITLKIVLILFNFVLCIISSCFLKASTF